MIEVGEPRRPVPGIRWRMLSLMLGAALAVGLPRAAPAAPTEQQVKAAMIFNITRFVGWPATAFDSPGAPLVVVILGQDAVSDVLQPMLRKKSVDGHPIEVRHARTVDEARSAHLLYIADSEWRHVDAIVLAARGTNLLTVANIEHFAERGGHVNLVLADQRIRIFVNPRSAEGSHLKISAKLLSLAQIVGSAP